MIRIARNSHKQIVYDMWKTVFGDSDEYMQLYFSEKYRSENTFLYFHNAKAVSSLQILPFRFTFWGEEITMGYLSGLCTLPQARGKGFMSRLIEAALSEMAQRGIALAGLVPQEEKLMNFYRLFGFEQTFEQGEPMPDLSEIIRTSANSEDAYQKFDKYFRTRDMTVQKTASDFQTIAKDSKLSGYPRKQSLSGMSRTVDARKLLSVFARNNPRTEFSVSISDRIIPENRELFCISKGMVSRGEQPLEIHLELSIGALTQRILGFKTSQLPDSGKNTFPEKKTLMAFMLE